MRKLYQSLCKLEEVVCGASFVLLISLVFLSAVLRLLRLNTAWNVDAALFLLAWTAFLGADIAWRKGGLVGLDLITKHLPFFLRKLIELLLYFILIGFLVLIVIFGTQLALVERIRQYGTIPIPYSLMTISLVVAALSMCCSTILKIRRCILNFRKEEEQEEAI